MISLKEEKPQKIFNSRGSNNVLEKNMAGTKHMISFGVQEDDDCIILVRGFKNLLFSMMK